jgi:hypothetical protein
VWSLSRQVRGRGGRRREWPQGRARTSRAPPGVAEEVHPTAWAASDLPPPAPLSSTSPAEDRQSFSRLCVSGKPFRRRPAARTSGRRPSFHSLSRPIEPSRQEPVNTARVFHLPAGIHAVRQGPAVPGTQAPPSASVSCRAHAPASRVTFAPASSGRTERRRDLRHALTRPITLWYAHPGRRRLPHRLPLLPVLRSRAQDLDTRSLDLRYRRCALVARVRHDRTHRLLHARCIKLLSRPRGQVRSAVERTVARACGASIIGASSFLSFASSSHLGRGARHLLRRPRHRDARTLCAAESVSWRRAKEGTRYAATMTLSSVTTAWAFIP